MLIKQAVAMPVSLLLWLFTAELSAGCAPSPLTALLGAAPALPPCEKFPASATVVPLSLLAPRVGLRRCRVFFRAASSQCNLGCDESEESLSYPDGKEETLGDTEPMTVSTKSTSEERMNEPKTISETDPLQEDQRLQSNESEMKEEAQPSVSPSRSEHEGDGCILEERVTCNERNGCFMISKQFRKRPEKQAACDRLCSKTCDLEVICKVLKEIRACPLSCADSSEDGGAEGSAHTRNRRRRTTDVAGAILTLALAGVVALVTVAVLAALLTAAVTAALVVAAWDTEHRPTPLPIPLQPRPI